MSKELVMNFLDKNKGKFFTVEEIFQGLDGEITLQNVYKNIKNITKREEYKAYVGVVGVHLCTYYGRIYNKTEED